MTTMCSKYTYDITKAMTQKAWSKIQTGNRGNLILKSFFNETINRSINKHCIHE